ncbi:MAG: hypothetical protein D6732_22095 [Methanobacteriota archaeon]|nr:MAG: hypothetical protein D6732_22095 [Euryarchaeota archaeon]
MRIKLMDHVTDQQIEEINKELEPLVIKFWTRKSGDEFAQEIVDNPETWKRLIYEAGGIQNITGDYVREIFPAFFQPLQAIIDIDEEMARPLVKWMLNNQEIIDNIDDIEEFKQLVEWAGFQITDKRFEYLLVKTFQSPEMLPEELRLTKMPEAMFSVKGMNGKELLVSLADVDKPQLLKELIFVDPELNTPLVDEQGRHMLLMPLIPFGKDGLDRIVEAYGVLSAMFNESSPDYILCKTYGTTYLGMLKEGANLVFGNEEEKNEIMADIYMEALFDKGISKEDAIDFVRSHSVNEVIHKIRNELSSGSKFAEQSIQYIKMIDSSIIDHTMSSASSTPNPNP